MLDLIDRLVPQSEFAASMLDARQSVRVLKGGVDDQFFTPEQDANDRSRDHILFVGRLLPHKGIDRLIAALPPNLALVICGRPYDEGYYAMLRALAGGKQVRFLTSADDLELRELYRTALAVVLPSVYVDCYGQAHPWPELMGFSLLEAMACATPAICSRVGGMPEYVDHGRTGFVFDELAELREYMERLAADPDLVRELGHAARRRVELEFGLASTGRTLTAIYDELLEVGHREGARSQQPVPA
jgi:glycosyltransferase involved in cell wall biosynthesis